MALKFAVMSIFKAKDEQSKQFNKMGKNAKKFGEKSDKAFKRASKSAKGFGAITKGILSAGAITKGLGLLTQGLGASTTAFLDFDDAITAASAKFKGLDLNTKAGQKTLKKLGKTARDVASKTKFGAAEAGAGLDFYATAGFNAAQAMKLLRPTADLAMASNLGIARTSDIASDSLAIFGLKTDNANKLQKNFKGMSDQMAFTMTSTNTTLDEMFETIKGGAGIFTNSGQSMSTFNTLVRSLADSSIKGGKAGTGLKAMMAKLAKPTGEAAEKLKEMGVQTTDGKGNFRDLFDVLGDMEKAYKKMGTQEGLATTKTIFGLETMNAFSAVMKTGVGNLRKYRKEVENSAGSTKKMSDIMGKSLKNRIASVKSALTEVAFKFFEAFGGGTGGMLDSIADKVRKFDLTPIIDTIKIVIEKVKMVFRTMEKAGVIDLLIQSFKTLVGVIKFVWKIAEPIFKLMWEILSPIIKGITTVMKGAEFLAKGAGFVFDQIGQNMDAESTIPGMPTEAELAKYHEDRAAKRQPPNAAQVQNQTIRSEANASMRLDIAGAPEGSKLTKQKGADPVDVRMLGPTPSFVS